VRGGCFKVYENRRWKNGGITRKIPLEQSHRRGKVRLESPDKKGTNFLRARLSRKQEKGKRTPHLGREERTLVYENNNGGRGKIATVQEKKGYRTAVAGKKEVPRAKMAF